MIQSRVDSVREVFRYTGRNMDLSDPIFEESWCDRVLAAVGRQPNTEKLGLDTVGIELDDRGRIPVNEHLATRADGIHAIGDVIEGPMLAHKAEDEGIACVERIVTGYGHVNYQAIPSIVYTSPEVEFLPGDPQGRRQPRSLPVNFGDLFTLYARKPES